jgi:hypothetical protein
MTFDQLVQKIESFRERILASELRDFEHDMLCCGASEEVIASELERGRKSFDERWPSIRDALAREAWSWAMEGFPKPTTSEPAEIHTLLQ